MDHDAMLRHVNKLKQFMADFLTMSQLTPEEFHTMAERVRAGESRFAVERSMRQDPDDGDEDQIGYDKAEGLRNGEPLEPVPGHDGGSANSSTKLTGDEGNADKGTGTDPDAGKEAAGASTDGEKGEAQGDQAKPASEATKPA